MVLVVDHKDTVLGTMPKTDAHRQGILHRAFSVFVFNSAGNLLLQRRADHKYHSGGLWTNTCCSHPAAGTDIYAQAVSRTRQEMGITPDRMRHVGSVIYRADLDRGMVEHEFDHIFVGYSDQMPDPNPDEVSGYLYMPFPEVRKAVSVVPGEFTVWFRIIMEHLGDAIGDNIFAGA